MKMESKEEILEEIKRLKQQLKELGEQIIDFELPKNYDKMSDEEKKAYHKRQDELKRKALENMDNYSVIVNDYAIVKYPSNKTIVKKFAREVAPFSVIPLERDTFKKTVSESVREKHKQDLSDIELLIDRYNSTKAIRNDKIEFGVNFNNFIETYFSKQACKTLARLADKEFLKLENRKPDKNGNLINGEVVFQNLTEDQRKKLIKIRIKMFAEKLNKLQRIATAKVHHDSKQKIQTFLEKYGFMNNQVEFRDGSRKFTTAKSVVSSSGVDMSKIKKRRKSELKSVAETRKDRYEQAQHNIIELNVMRDKFDTFIKNFKGNGRQFSVEFQQNFPKIAKKLYDEKTKNSAMAFSSQNLMSSPISVQQHEIDKQFNEEFRKENNRLRYSAYFIPASEVAAGYFLG